MLVILYNVEAAFPERFVIWRCWYCKPRDARHALYPKCWYISAPSNSRLLSASDLTNPCSKAAYIHRPTNNYFSKRRPYLALFNDFRLLLRDKGGVKYPKKSQRVLLIRSYLCQKTFCLLVYFLIRFEVHTHFIVCLLPLAISCGSQWLKMPLSSISSVCRSFWFEWFFTDNLEAVWGLKTLVLYAGWFKPTATIILKVVETKRYPPLWQIAVIFPTFSGRVILPVRSISSLPHTNAHTDLSFEPEEKTCAGKYVRINSYTQIETNWRSKR